MITFYLKFRFFIDLFLEDDSRRDVIASAWMLRGPVPVAVPSGSANQLIFIYTHIFNSQLIAIKLTLRRVQISGSLGKHFACNRPRRTPSISISI